MTLRSFLLLSTLSTAFFAAIVLLSVRQATPIPEHALAGKQVWQRNNCISCHTLFGNGGYLGADLTNITAQKDPSELIEYLVDPPVMPPHKHTRHPSLTKAESEELINYLEYLHTIPTLAWPPQDKTGGSS